jgi:hypothetical protein
MSLDPRELDSSAWLKVQTFIELQITQHSRNLERDKSELETAKLRGQIKALRNLLSFARGNKPDEL